MQSWIKSALIGACVVGVVVGGYFLLPRVEPVRSSVNDALTNSPTVVNASETQPSKPSYPEFTELGVQSSKSHAIVIMYHDVVMERTRDTMAYDITAEQFREDLEFMKEEGATFISMQQLYEHLTQGTPIPHRSVVLTFDDNYQGVYDYAVPVLKEFDAPWTMFVHTDFVGDTTRGRPKMTWETLKGLIADAKLTVGGHTASHPDDISLLTDEQKRSEIFKSMEAIEANLGAKTPYMAWANGKFDETTKMYAEEAGYRISFTMDSGLTGTSPGILEINRYPWQKTRLGWEEREQWLAQEDLWQSARFAFTTAPVEKVEAKYRRSEFVAIQGGAPASVLVDGRASVGDLVKQFGGVGGINGGFFVMAAIAATDNKMIGPTVVSNRSEFLPSAAGSQASKLYSRPLVLWSPTEVRIEPYDPTLHDTEDQVRGLLSGATDVFLAGCWLVCDGVALSKDQILRHGPSDAMDWRKRAFIGWKADGTLICGASTGSVSAEWLARGAVELGCQYAVMLDSGFSTSLVLHDEILASGHSNKDHPSRPVPHAIIVKDATGTPASSPPAETPESKGNPETSRYETGRSSEDGKN